MVFEHILRMIVIIMITIITVYPVVYKDNGTFELKKTTTDKMKGVACIMVVIGHATFQLDGKGVFSLTWNLGFLALAIFFFVTGYGVITNIKNKEEYLKGFLKKRLLTILIPFWLSNVFVLLINYYDNSIDFDLWAGLKYVLGIKLMIGHNWYVQYIVCFYILFFISAKMIKKH